MGKDSLIEAIDSIKDLGFKKTLIVTDSVLNNIGLVKKVTDLLSSNGVETVVFDETQPNPTVKNVNDGHVLYKKEGCDSIITLGGSSPHDCGKGIAITTSNPGKIENEGLDKTVCAVTPLVSVNTTAGTASEMRVFALLRMKLDT